MLRQSNVYFYLLGLELKHMAVCAGIIDTFSDTHSKTEVLYLFSDSWDSCYTNSYFTYLDGPEADQRRLLTLPRTPCGLPNYVIASYVRAFQPIPIL